MNTPSSPRQKAPPPTIVTQLGAILAQGVIRLHDRQKNLAERTEERVHRGPIDTQETPV